MQTTSGKGQAITSLVLGILSVVFSFLGISLLAVICGIIGLLCANSAKKVGFSGGMRTAGFVISIVGLAFGGIMLLGVAACSIGANSLLRSFGL